MKIKRIMKKHVDFYESIVIEYEQLTGIFGFRKLKTFQVYGSPGRTTWRNLSNSVVLIGGYCDLFSSQSLIAKRLLTQFDVPYTTWLDLDNRSMESLSENEINDVVFKIIKVEK